MKTNVLMSVLILLLSACSLVQKKNIGLSKSDSTKKRILASAKADVLRSDCSKFPGFIPVLGNTHLGTGDFCVMEYQAKAWRDANNNGDVDDYEIYSGDGEGTSNWGFLETHVPASVSKGKPWREISRDSAINECRELNGVYGISEDSDKKFDLISNFEWLTIARDIERQSVNWSSNRSGSGCVYQDNNGLDTPCSYDGANPERGANNAKARYILSNGESINHFSGKVWEWEVKNNAILLGGNWGNYDNAGLFGTGALYSGPSNSYNGVDFRCVFRTVSSGSSPIPRYE